MALIDKPRSRLVIDLEGPEGNAFALLGKAHRMAKEIGLDWPSIEAEMTSGTYRTLVLAFDKHFGAVCDLILPNNWSDCE